MLVVVPNARATTARMKRKLRVKPKYANALSACVRSMYMAASDVDEPA